MRNIRKDTTYQAMAVDLAMLGVISKEECETLLKAENSKDKEKAIKVNGVKYTPITMKKGDIIKFGNYPQDSDGNKAPIEWLVLDFNEKTEVALLISRYGLDCGDYNDEWRKDITRDYSDRQ